MRMTPGVDVIKYFLEGILDNLDSPSAGTGTMNKYKSNMQFLQIILVEKSIHCFHILVQVQSSEQTFFNLLILG